MAWWNRARCCWTCCSACCGGGDTFVRSPGLGGLAALGAAWVGFRQWRRQGQADAELRLERVAAEHRARQDAQWWEVYRLAHGARPAVPGTGSHPDEVLLRALLASAETDIQTAAAVALTAAYASDVGGHDEEQTTDDD